MRVQYYCPKVLVTKGETMHLRTQASLVGTAALLCALVTACGSSGSSSGSSKTSTGGPSSAPITIAAVNDLTGSDSDNGASALAGINAAVKAVNAAGGVKGRQLVVKSFDTQTTDTGTQSAFRAAIAANPVAITGMVALDPSSASVLRASGILILGATYPDTATDPLPNYFTASPTGAQVAKGTVQGLKSLLGSVSGKSIGVEGLVNSAVDLNIAGIKKDVAAAGGSMGPIIRDQAPLSTWSSQAANMVHAHPDAVVVNNQTAADVVVVKALTTAGFNGPVVGTEGESGDNILQEVNNPNFVVVREVASPTKGSTLYDQGIAVGATEAQMQENKFAKEYASVFAIAKALEACGADCPSSKLPDALKGLGDINVPNDAVLGPLNFSNSQAGLTTAQLWQWDATKSVASAKGPKFSLN